jgi:hypothetical protein
MFVLFLIAVSFAGSKEQTARDACSESFEVCRGRVERLSKKADATELNLLNGILAETWLRHGEKERDPKVLQALRAHFPERSEAAQAWEVIAELAWKELPPQATSAQLETFLEEYAGTKVCSEASMVLPTAVFGEIPNDAAPDVWEAYQLRFPDGIHQQEAEHALANALYNAGDDASWLELLRRFPDDEAAGQALTSLGRRVEIESWWETHFRKPNQPPGQRQPRQVARCGVLRASWELPVQVEAIAVQPSRAGRAMSHEALVSKWVAESTVAPDQIPAAEAYWRHTPSGGRAEIRLGLPLVELADGPDAWTLLLTTELGVIEVPISPVVVLNESPTEAASIKHCRTSRGYSPNLFPDSEHKVEWSQQGVSVARIQKELVVYRPNKPILVVKLPAWRTNLPVIGAPNGEAVWLLRRGEQRWQIFEVAPNGEEPIANIPAPNTGVDRRWEDRTASRLSDFGGAVFAPDWNHAIVSVPGAEWRMMNNRAWTATNAKANKVFAFKDAGAWHEANGHGGASWSVFHDSDPFGEYGRANITMVVPYSPGKTHYSDDSAIIESLLTQGWLPQARCPLDGATVEQWSSEYSERSTHALMRNRKRVKALLEKREGDTVVTAWLTDCSAFVVHHLVVDIEGVLDEDNTGPAPTGPPPMGVIDRSGPLVLFDKDAANHFIIDKDRTMSAGMPAWLFHLNTNGNISLPDGGEFVSGRGFVEGQPVPVDAKDTQLLIDQLWRRAKLIAPTPVTVP